MLWCVVCGGVWCVVDLVVCAHSGVCGLALACGDVEFMSIWWRTLWTHVQRAPLSTQTPSNAVTEGDTNAFGSGYPRFFFCSRDDQAWGSLTPWPGTAEVLALLQSKGIILAPLSNGDHNTLLRAVSVFLPQVRLCGEAWAP